MMPKQVIEMDKQAMQEKLAHIQAQEQELQFAAFNNQTALRLGLLIIELAKKENKQIAVEITKNGQKLFYHAMDGTSPDQEHWIRRKSRVVERHYHSSYYMRFYNELKNRSYFDAYSVSPEEYAVHGGSFPITIKNTGVVGTVTVSGVSQEEDHQLIVTAIRILLQQEI
jgi:uncharacterized protein (UPF0303 family)